MPSQQSRITYAGQSVVLPDKEQYPKAHLKATSYNCPLGPATGVGYVLLTKEQMDQFGTGDNFANLVFETNTEEASQKVTLRRLYIHSSTLLNPGSEEDPDGVYLVKLVDPRFHLNKWSSTQRQFNVRSFAGKDPYLAETISVGGAAFGWSRIISDLWDDCGPAGSFPGLPVTPTAPPPENLHFVGVNAWHALHSVLEKIGLTSRYNPLTGLFSIVEMQSAVHDPPEFDDLIFQAFPFSGGACVAPFIIRVMFKVTFEDYGQENDTGTSGSYITSQNTIFFDIENTDFAVPDTRLVLWDDLPAIKGHAVNAIINQQELGAKAQQRANAWFQENSASQNSRGLGVGQGALNITPSGVIKHVLWRDYGSEGGGMLTEAAKYPGIFHESPEDAMSIGSSGSEFGSGDGGSVDESSMAPDFGRHTYPNYPRLPNFVVFSEGTRADDCCPSEGDMLEAYEDQFFFGGAVIRFDSVSGQMIILEACWIYALGERKCDVGPIVRSGDVANGRLSGVYTAKTGDSAGLKLPLYVVRVDDYLSIEVKCNCGDDVRYASSVFRKCKVDNITFDQGIGFRMFQPNNNVDGACLTIESPCSNSILNQWTKGQRPVWTQDPVIDGNLTIGGVLKFSGRRDVVGGSVTVRSGEHISLGATGGGTADCFAPVEVIGVRENCVQWGYGPVGLSGFITVYECLDVGYGCKNLFFTNGRLITSEGGTFETPTSCGIAPCPMPDKPPCNPCNTTFEVRGPTGEEIIDPPIITDPGEGITQVTPNPNPGPFQPEEEGQQDQTGPQDNPPVLIEGVPNALGVNRQLEVPRCTETFACGEDTNEVTCGRIIGIMERGWEDFQPLQENQALILAEFAPIMGPNDYERFRETLARCVAAEIADLAIIEGIGENQVDDCTGLTFTNVTPSNGSAFAAGLGLINNAFLSFRPFTEASYNNLLAIFDEGGGSELELSEFQQLRTIAACYFDVDREAAEEGEN